jgi:hypothetical protein
LQLLSPQQHFLLGQQDKYLTRAPKANIGKAALKNSLNIAKRTTSEWNGVMFKSPATTAIKTIKATNSLLNIVFSLKMAEGSLSFSAFRLLLVHGLVNLFSISDCRQGVILLKSLQ